MIDAYVNLVDDRCILKRGCLIKLEKYRTYRSMSHVSIISDLCYSLCTELHALLFNTVVSQV